MSQPIIRQIMNTNQNNAGNTANPIVPVTQFTTRLGATITDDNAFFLVMLESPDSIKDIRLQLREWFLTFAGHYDFEHQLLSIDSSIELYRNIDDFLGVTLDQTTAQAKKESTDDLLSPESYESTKATLQALADSNTQLRKERDSALKMFEEHTSTINDLRRKLKEDTNNSDQSKADEGNPTQSTDTDTPKE